VNISIIGATGEVGRSLAAHLLRSGLMTTTDELQLVGHGAGGVERTVLGERVDLLDAFDETAPRIEVAATPEQVTGQVVVMAAGATVSKQTRTRRELAAKNRPVFEAFAAALAHNGAGQGGVVVVTNPVELGVEILSRHLDRHRVLGMGAQQDSLRFARAIANDAGVRRDRVHAWVLGEHGEAQVPLWSSVRLLGESSEEDRQRVEGLRAGRGLGDPAPDTENPQAASVRSARRRADPGGVRYGRSVATGSSGDARAVRHGSLSALDPERHGERNPRCYPGPLWRSRLGCWRPGTSGGRSIQTQHTRRCPGAGRYRRLVEGSVSFAKRRRGRAAGRGSSDDRSQPGTVDEMTATSHLRILESGSRRERRSPVRLAQRRHVCQSDSDGGKKGTGNTRARSRKGLPH